ncbi:putative integral membrane protein (TIGR00701 family) [Hoeflea marina]|uniref:Protoporphyrinogen IX oxidase n=1 Tax=Hoeflea marina TaxID=274592 RepID=A0A317PEW5_9HYPH|nr:CopD family protein [Hoeflea marina]PWV97656.1 putative integral membrane protein (TIGR00701 family) [Hoeflea marina]
MDTYLWLKAAHIASVVAWIGGMLLLGVVHRLIATGAMTEERLLLIRQALKWDHRVSQPALGGVWLFGIAVAAMGHWFSSPWLMAKLAIVIFLSALHGIQAGRLRRFANDPARVPPAFLRHSAAITIACMIAIVVLVVTKPF